MKGAHPDQPKDAPPPSRRPPRKRWHSTPLHESDAMRKNKSKRPRSATPSRGSIRSSSASVIRYRASKPALPSATALDERRYCGIPYVDCHFYFDTLKYLSKSEITAADQDWLRANSKHFDMRQHGDWIVIKGGRSYQLNIYPYRFRIEIHVPYPERDPADLRVLEFFASLPDTIITAAHPARDFTFDSEIGPNAILRLFAECWVQRWQRKHSLVTFANGGISTGRRSRGSYLTAYVPEFCRITGELHSFHGESRILGTKALEKIGIKSAQDPLQFDHSGYWRSKDAECLRTIDKRRLGRLQRNRAKKTRDQHEHAHDLRIGGLIWRKYAWDQNGEFSLQQFIRRYPAARVAKNIIGTVDTEGRKP
ncbi:hypothetical protein [Bradyrhizobium liaoningense]